MYTYYVDGHCVPADRAVIPVDDLSILRGLGVFELMRTYKGRPFAVDAHLNRLMASARRLGIDIPWTRQEMTRILLDLVRKNQKTSGELNIRVVVTAGSSPDFMTPQGKPRLLMLVSPLPRLPQEWYEKGISVITVFSERKMPEVKSINYTPATLAMEEARRVSAAEALYVDREGCVREGTTSNVFAFINERLVTPAEGILKGVTRQAVLDLAEGRHVIELRAIPLSELMSASEIFITGTNKGIVPVVRVNDTPVGNGLPGARTRQLMARLADYTAEDPVSAGP